MSLSDNELWGIVAKHYCNSSRPDSTELLNIQNRSLGFHSPMRHNICMIERYPIEDQMGTWFSVLMYTYVYPILLVLTAVATFFVVLVLTKRSMRSSTNMVLLYMAVADLFVTLLPFPFVVIYVLLGYYQDTQTLRRSWCYLALYSTDALPPLCHNIAIWLTVLLAAQRLIYIQRPMSARTICSVKNIQISTIVIVGVSGIFTLPKFLDISEMDIMDLWYKANGTGLRDQRRFCVMRYSALVQEAIGSNYYFSFFYWSRVLLFVLIPSVILVVVSSLLVRGIQKAKRRKDQLLAARRTRDAARQGESNNTTTMLVFVVVIFLIVNLPQGTVLAMFCIEQMTNTHLLQSNGEVIQKVVLIDNFLIIATYPINFAIYCSMSTQFRSHFRRLFTSRVSMRGGRPLLEQRPRSSRRGSEGIYYRMNGFLPDGPEISSHPLADGCRGDSSPMPEISHV